MSTHDYTTVQKVHVNYTTFGNLMNRMVEKILSSQHDFVAVHGLPRGGSSIAVHLSHFLKLPMVINLTHFKNEFPNGKLLVVDDIIDSGKTFERFLEIAELKHIPFETAVLFYKPHSSYTPDYFIEETIDWIVFPWEPMEEIPNREVYEHLGGSIESTDTGLGIELESELEE